MKFVTKTVEVKKIVQNFVTVAVGIRVVYRSDVIRIQ